MNNHVRLKFGPDSTNGMSIFAFANSSGSNVDLYQILPVPLVSTSLKYGAIIGLLGIGNALGVYSRYG